MTILLQPKERSISAFRVGEGWYVLDDTGRRKYLNGDERARFLRAADTLPLRMRAHVLAFADCRISECPPLTREQLDRDRLALIVRTLKRRRLVFRVVPIPQATFEMLARLPVGASGHFWPYHRATAWRVVKATMRRAGIAGPMVCPKGLRHGFGIRAASRNVPANLSQRWMGHASPTTTAIYIDAVGPEERQFATRMW